MSDYPVENILGHTKRARFVVSCIAKEIDLAGERLNLLDFGCGNGNALSRFFMLEGVRYWGVDVHEPSLEYARANYAGPASVFQERVPADVRFDVVVYADVLEHLQDPLVVLREHGRIVKEGGIIVGSVPNGFGPSELEKRVDERLRLSRIAVKVRAWMVKMGYFRARIEPNLPYNYDSGHLQFFTKRSLVAMMEQAGFEVECFRHGTFFGAPLSGVLLRGNAMARFNAKVADYLPHWAVSRWYFIARKRSSSRTPR